VKSGSGRTPRDPRKQSSRVDDKIKKRMSMRYNDVASPTDGNVPAMPGMPVGLMSQASMRGRPGREQDEVVKDREDAKLRGNDNQLLDTDEFDPDACMSCSLWFRCLGVTDVCYSSSENQAAELDGGRAQESSVLAPQCTSRHSCRSAAECLQEVCSLSQASGFWPNCLLSYAEFVLISKEISTLENEMLELKESLSEYKSMPSLLHVPDPSSNGANSSNAMSMYKRSSVADLRIMYFNQMQTLHSTIEGSAKFAPNTPGRHIVAEIEGILALNPATYKISGKVKFVVLDDAVLVAKRRRRAGGQEGGRGGGSISEGKLVAERCWPLNEMLVLDTKDSASKLSSYLPSLALTTVAQA
jgi:exocyst complex component 8